MSLAYRRAGRSDETGSRAAPAGLQVQMRLRASENSRLAPFCRQGKVFEAMNDAQLKALRLGRMWRSWLVTYGSMHCELWASLDSETLHQCGKLHVKVKRHWSGLVDGELTLQDERPVRIAGREREWTLCEQGDDVPLVRLQFSKRFHLMGAGPVQLNCESLSVKVQMPLSNFGGHTAHVSVPGCADRFSILLSTDSGVRIPKQGPPPCCTFLRDVFWTPELCGRSLRALIAGLLPLIAFQPLIQED
jgi:hypothetical protein